MKDLVALVCVGLFLVYLPVAARSQNQGLIVRDASLGVGQGEVVAPGIDPSGSGGEIVDYLITPELGEQRGGNLFHSFSLFGVGGGEIAQFTDAGATQRIHNIVVRVTGNEVSGIAGMLRSSIDRADLYLLNPKGIRVEESGGIAGVGRSFRFPGSVFLSTADQLDFQATGGGGIGSFRVSDLEAPWSSPDCCTSDPAKFVFAGASLEQRANPAIIDVYDPARMSFEARNTFFVAAGGVRITNTDLNIRRGSVALAAVGDAAAQVGHDPVYVSHVQGLDGATRRYRSMTVPLDDRCACARRSSWHSYLGRLAGKLK